MKTVKIATTAAAALVLASLASAAQTVLSFDIETSLDIDYSSNPFDLQIFSGIPDENDFLADYPVAGLLPGASTSDYAVYGFSSYLYNFADDFLAPSFDSSATYYWTIDVDYGYDTSVTPIGGLTATSSDTGTEHQEGLASLNNIINFLYGIAPTNLGAIGASIPASGPLTDLVLNAGDFTSESHEWLTDTGFAGNAYYSYSSSGPALPSGEIQIALDSPIAGLEAATSYRFSNLLITARTVADSGSTSLMAIVGVGILLLAKRRIVR